MGETKSKRGGARPGAGRKPGVLGRKTREIAKKAAEQGVTPLEVLIDTMRSLAELADKARGANRVKLLMSAAGVAKDAAPYFHPRLASIEHTGDGGGPIQVTVKNYVMAAGA